MTSRRVRDVPQRPLPGEHREPVHRGPDRVLDALSALTVEHAGVDQLVEYSAELTEGRTVPPGPVFGNVVAVRPRQGERGGEQTRLIAGELQVCGTDRVQPATGRAGIAVPATHAGDASRHA